MTLLSHLQHAAARQKRAVGFGPAGVRLGRATSSRALVGASDQQAARAADSLSCEGSTGRARHQAHFFNRKHFDGSRDMHASSFRGVDRQPQATTGKGSQVGLPILGSVSAPQLLAPEVIGRATFNGVLSEAARHSGLDDQDIADALNICHGYMSRFMRGVAQQWAKRLVMFMRVTKSLAPLQWIADQLGCEVVQRDARAAEVALLKARLLDLEHGRAA